MKNTVRFVLAFATLLSFAAIGSAQTDAQKAFDKLKTLTGTWEGAAPDGTPARITYRVASGGSALLAEIDEASMITVFHLDGDRLIMTHYCGAGNQPRMVGKLSPDGKSIAFDFLDVTNLSSPEAGHMHHAVFTMADANNHSESWTYRAKGQDETHRFDVHRVATASAKSPSAKVEEHSH